MMPAAAGLWFLVPPGDPDPASGKGPEWGEAAPVGLLIWLLMGIALFLLIKSMNRNLRKVPESFDPPSDDDGAASVAEFDAAETDAGMTDTGAAGDDDASGAAGEPAEEHAEEHADEHGEVPGRRR